MIVAEQPNRRSAKLVIVDADGGMRHLPRREIGSLFNPGDLVVANDAATLPASLHGTHSASGKPIEIRLAAWVSVGDPTQFAAIAFGAGDFRARTEVDRLPRLSHLVITFLWDRLSRSLNGFSTIPVCFDSAS
jgi:S-adenosylmethionine:tRNA ribosyltransferase-isomerase